MKIIKRVIQNKLNKHGYYKASVPEGDTLTEKDIIELYKTYGENTTFRRHLRDLCENDKELYFIATDDRERDMIRGATQRTKYFLALINKANGETNKERNRKDGGSNKGVSGKVNRVEGVNYYRSKE